MRAAAARSVELPLVRGAVAKAAPDKMGQRAWPWGRSRDFIRFRRSAQSGSLPALRWGDLVAAGGPTQGSEIVLLEFFTNSGSVPHAVRRKQLAWKTRLAGGP